MECKHHNICGLTDEFDPEGGLCILHSQKVNKDIQAFIETLTVHRKVKGDQFDSIVFPGVVDGREATFTKYISFSGATFTEDGNFSYTTFTEGTDFREVTFTKHANFSYARFTRHADFSMARFTEGVDFSHATFTEGANFSHVRFTEGAYFGSVTFTGDTDFSGATFTEGAYFGSVTFTGDTDFSMATFTKLAGFVGAVFTGGADFSWVVFLGGGNFQGTRFSGSAITFEGSHFSGRVLFTGGSQQNSLIFQDATAVDFRNMMIDSPENLSFRHANFETCQFCNTDLRKVELTGVRWPPFPKGRDWPWIPKSGRRVVYDEILALQLAERDRRWEDLERLYRELKQNYEDRRDYARSGDFHYGEKEMQRQNPATSFSLWLFLSLYRMVSGYGERFLRPLLWAAGLLVVSAGVYLWCGLVPKALPISVVPGTPEFFTMPGAVTRRAPRPIHQLNEWVNALHYSFRVMLLLKPEDPVPMGFATVVQTLQSLLGPLFLGLFALAVRQRLKH
jgi:uncharacterized protein YjbI with pentapeptide repeats